MFKDVKFSFAGEILEKKRFSYISTANFPPNRTFSLPLQFSEDLVTSSREILNGKSSFFVQRFSHNSLLISNVALEKSLFIKTRVSFNLYFLFAFEI